MAEGGTTELDGLIDAAWPWAHQIELLPTILDVRVKIAQVCITETGGECPDSQRPLIWRSGRVGVGEKPPQSRCPRKRSRLPTLAKSPHQKLSEKRSQVTLHQLLRWNNFRHSRHALPHACGPEPPALRQ